MQLIITALGSLQLQTWKIHHQNHTCEWIFTVLLLCLCLEFLYDGMNMYFFPYALLFSVLHFILSKNNTSVQFSIDHKEQIHTNNSKTTLIHASFVSIHPSICDSHVQHQLLKRPAIGLGNTLACCSYIGFRIEQSTQPYMESLKSEIWKTRWVEKELQSLILTSYTFSHNTFSSLAPPCETSSETSCNCFTRWLKSVIHWMTVHPRGTV